MSKRNMLLGLAAGKVGDLVFYRDGGEQRTRTRVIPKNPRSPLQMAQRVRMANISALYRVLAPVIRDSFSNRPSNQSGYNAMASGAIELSPFMTKAMANADSVLPMPAVISKGVIPSAPFSISAAGGATGVFLTLNALADVDAPVSTVSAAIIAADPTFQYGDSLTFVGVQFVVDELSEDADVYNAYPTIKTLVLDSEDTRTIGSLGFAVSEVEIGVNVVRVDSGSDVILAAAVIHSRVDEQGALQTSFARLELNDAAQSLYDGYRTEQALQEAISSYSVGSESILR